ncbi:hypothetical protein NKH85_11145 [Mesorhizobium sp. M0924]|uniref:hypothetical protein n=2 Tax=unclassified Mesorhizobium TaxID=325217 RepID=UPI003338F05B
MMAEAQSTGSLLTLRSIVIGVVCIAAANIVLEGLRRLVELPFSDTLESMAATGMGVLVWFSIVLRGKR